MPIEVKKFDNEGKELAIRFGLGGIKAVGIGMVQDMVENRKNHGGKFNDIYDFVSNAGPKAINKKSLEALAKSGSFDSIHPSRSQIVESVDILCKYASSKIDEKNSNQLSLFADAKIAEEKPTLKKTVEWSAQEKLNEEFGAFGFFLKEHPIDSYLEALGKRGVISSVDLDDINDGNIIKLAGVVAYSKHKSGPKGRYAYLTLSDPFGIFETSIFDEALITQNRDTMADGNSLVVECSARRDQGGLRLLVRSIENLENFIKNHHPHKEIFKDIKSQERRGEFDWKKRKQENHDPKNDSLVAEMEYRRKIEELKNKKILTEIDIEVKNREAILNVKGFLSQRMAPTDFETYTKVYFLIGDTKMHLDEKYLIDENDFSKIKNIVLKS